MEALKIAGMLVVALVAWAAMWSGIVAMIGVFSGWRSLASRFASQAPPTEQWLTSGRFRTIQGYSGTLYVGGSPAGLHLRVLLPFRPGHPPMVVPWDRIEVTGPAFSLWGEWIELDLDGTTLALSKTVWEAASALRDA